MNFFFADYFIIYFSYNWMLLDTVHLMLQSGYRVLPQPHLPEGLHLPPRAMDGISAPISRYTDPTHASISKVSTVAKT